MILDKFSFTGSSTTKSEAAQISEKSPQLPAGCPYHPPATPNDVLPAPRACASNIPSAYDTRATTPLSHIDPVEDGSNEAAVGINPANMQFTNDDHGNGALPLKRLVSSIPRTSMNEDEEKQEFWVYPSQQQFYNAMKRKNFEPSEDDMAVVVSMHNAVNEMTWRKIVKWEAKYKETCGKTTLKKFAGKAEDYSPKAKFLSFIGYEKPFDRHDWVVDRCGTEVRYIIDFYNGKPAPNSLNSIHIDVRPALDSLQNFYDRVEFFIADLLPW